MRMAKMLAIGTIALGTIGQTGWGQEERGVTEQTTVEQTLGTRWLDIDFKGGTLAELVRAIKTKHPRANIMLLEGAGELKIPAFQVFDVSPAGALWVAKNIADDGRNLKIDTVKAQDGSSPTTLVRVERQSAQDFMPPSWTNPSRAWNLRSWLGDDEQRIAATFAAIQVGLDTFGTQTVLMKYHEPTGVLMARGSQAQIDFIESIVEAASESSGSAIPIEVQNAPSVIFKSSKRIAEIEGDAAVLAARADVVNARIIRLIEDKAGEETIATQRVELAEILARITNLRFEEEALRAAVENAKKILADHEAKSKR